ncbi:sugar phosphate isomerase/epimerase family protein [Enterococcus pallens]|uniref:Xylose isomerase-like TIM barrel domain-containing protein n=1 Tax=Enterococcus pallens ATCC BAA-351 TaxID=1158607 RepID=R2Q5E8_9ENTE|nr:sugar phosphate isomerase/epimerase [Enterococcus pallens]EOH91767.1 hypothetical protein UAU_03069 [Enterococcus pallens ATCC BAA-351]EOU25195.1 hypothetical protein I588_01183 [Enterococcus pallens ATCC BAA-351]OJG80006.1 hypothetical protein RV10_GL005076 [Enterococcus pallens]
MELGIFSKGYKNYELTEAFTRIKQSGLSSVQFNFANVGLASLPEAIPEETLQQIQTAAERTGISLAVISGTFNTLELEEATHQQNLHNFQQVVQAAAKLGVPFVSISTGSFNQEDFWSPHPDNHTEKAWSRLYRSLDEMIAIAAGHQVVIVVEPEQANVVSTVEDTLRLMAHYQQSPYLKVLFDAANIVTTEDADQLEKKILTALDKLKDYVAVAHCKDAQVTKEKIEFKAVGKGNLPLKSYLEKLRESYQGPVIMHGLEEDEVEFALNYLEQGQGEL